MSTPELAIVEYGEYISNQYISAAADLRVRLTKDLDGGCSLIEFIVCLSALCQ